MRKRKFSHLKQNQLIVDAFARKASQTTDALLINAAPFDKIPIKKIKCSSVECLQKKLSSVLKSHLKQTQAHLTAGRQQNNSINNKKVPYYILLSTTRMYSNQSALTDRCWRPLCGHPSRLYWVRAASIHNLTISIIMTQTEGLRGHRPDARPRLLRPDHTHHRHCAGETQSRSCIIWMVFVCRWLSRRRAYQLIKC